MKFNRAIHAAVVALVCFLLLAACNNEPEETEASPTTGDATAFEVEGEVKTVEVENEDASPEASPMATEGTGTGSVDANIRARLLVQVESIKAETAELCDVDEGEEITLTLTNQSAFDQDQEPDDLMDLEGSSIRAEGNAEELAAGDREESASPSESPGASPDQAASPGGTQTRDPEAGCHFEVAKISINEDEGGEGVGDATSSPTPAPGGAGDVPGANATPGDTGTPSGQATPTATPGGTMIQGDG